MLVMIHRMAESAIENASEPRSKGVGEIYPDGQHIRAELMDARHAVDNGWYPSAELREKLLGKLAAALDNPKTTTRTALQIARFIRSVDAQDMARERQPTSKASQGSHEPSEPAELSAADRQALLDLARQGSQPGPEPD